MAEEAKEPRRDMPRAILLVTVGGGLLFIVLSWAAQVPRPSTTFETADSGATEVMTTIGGNRWRSSSPRPMSPAPSGRP